jgi:hypothetical protein
MPTVQHNLFLIKARLVSPFVLGRYDIRPAKSLGYQQRHKKTSRMPILTALFQDI